jgi:hypothetical protein
VVLEALWAGISEEAIIEAAGSQGVDLGSDPFIPFDPNPDPLLLRRPSLTSIDSNRAILPRGSNGSGTPSQPLYFRCDNCSWNRAHRRRQLPRLDECTYDDGDTVEEEQKVFCTYCFQEKLTPDFFDGAKRHELCSECRERLATSSYNLLSS